jgi:hypothetical protein
MKNLNVTCGIIAAIALSGISSTALADTYDITYTDGGANVANGEIDVVGGMAVSGTLTVTAGAADGTWTLQPGAGEDGSFIWDNQVNPASNPFLDPDGLLFVDGSSELNIWGNGADNYSLYGNIGGNYNPVSNGGEATLSMVSNGALPAASAPDGGWTAGLLGGSFLVLQGYRRKVAR